MEYKFVVDLFLQLSPDDWVFIFQEGIRSAIKLQDREILKMYFDETETSTASWVALLTTPATYKSSSRVSSRRDLRRENQNWARKTSWRVVRVTSTRSPLTFNFQQTTQTHNFHIKNIHLIKPFLFIWTHFEITKLQ